MMLNCKNCKAIFESEQKFCTNCGVELRKSDIQNRNESLNLVIVFYVVFLVFAVISYFAYGESPESLGTEIVIESVFALLVIGFSLFDFKNILKLYEIPQVNWKIIAFSLLFPVLSSFLVYFLIDILNTSVFETISDNYYEAYTYLDHPLFWSIIFIAILPPIFEELAFRGFLFNQLQKVVSAKMTIVATAFLFALIHFSFISFIWIFPFGLILGYVRHKYNTLWYGILIHFIHNLIVLMIDYYYYNSMLLELNY